MRINPLFQAKDPSHTSASCVTFEPGARSAWHTHPLGQILIVTAGTGWVQQEGGEKQEIKPGDVIWTPPGVKHWHGATATTAMTHIAVQGAVGGKNVDWMEKVSEEQYKMADTDKSDALPAMLTLDDVGWSDRRLRGTRKASSLAISGNALIYRRAIAASLPWRS